MLKTIHRYFPMFSRKRMSKRLISFFPVVLLLLTSSCAHRDSPHQLVRPEPPPEIHEHHGTFTIRIDPDDIPHYQDPQRLESLKNRGINTLTIDLFESFEPVVPLQTWERFQLPSTETSLSKEELRSFIDTVHEENMAVWAGITALPLSTAIQEDNPQLYNYLERWFMENEAGDNEPQTEPYFYLCPQHPLVRQFFLSLLDEFHETYSLDGTLLSGIHFPFLSNQPEHTFCMCKYCQDAAEEEYGLALNVDDREDDPRSLARQTLFYNHSLQNFIQYLRLATNIPESYPFLIDIIADYPPYQNPYYQDYIYWSEQIDDIEFLFTFRSLRSLFEHFADIEPSVPPHTLMGLQIKPEYFRQAEHSIDDFFQFLFLSQPFSTMMVDMRESSYRQVENFARTLSTRSIHYPWFNLLQSIETILKTEHEAPYLTDLSQRRVALIYTHLQYYLERKDTEEEAAAREILTDNWLGTTHLINIKNTPALKNLQVAYKYFHRAFP